MPYPLSAELLKTVQPIRRRALLTAFCTQCLEHVKCHTIEYVGSLSCGKLVGVGRFGFGEGVLVAVLFQSLEVPFQIPCVSSRHLPGQCTDRELSLNAVHTGTAGDGFPKCTSVKANPRCRNPAETENLRMLFCALCLGAHCRHTLTVAPTAAGSTVQDLGSLLRPVGH